MIKVYHFNNGSGGGVLSVIKNLVEYSRNPDIENHIIYTINKEKISHFEKPLITGTVTQQVFYYSPKWNFYYTCKQLAKLLPDEKAVIVAHDWLELGMASHLGLQNPVVHYIHGDYEYYYDLAERHRRIIDVFITVADKIKVKLIARIPERNNDIEYVRFPVPDAYDRVEGQNRCNVVFVGRLTKGKGYHLLPAIAFELMKKNVNAHWHIIGEDTDGLRENTFWNEGIHVKHYGLCSAHEVRAILATMDFIILPSAFEGMPVSVVEAMKSGVIPIVNDIEGGIQELVVNDKTGFKIENNDVRIYAERIAYLLRNQEKTEGIKNKCIGIANRNFHPVLNTYEMQRLLTKVGFLVKSKKKNKIYGSRLDKIWIPNSLVTRFRNFKG